MCGIFGFVHLDQNKSADRKSLIPMGNTLIHRGPDDQGEHIERYVALGHRRLSIIDISENGRQPMSNENGAVWIVFNGEIYNFIELTIDLKKKGHVFKSQTDTEVIVHLYEEYGIDCLSRIHGMFAFVLWDRSRNETFIVRDRIGIKPLHYAEMNGSVLFASEIKALLKHPEISKAIDHDALNEYLSFDYVPAPKTIFRDIKKLLPGHYIHIQNGRRQIVCYWSVKYEDIKRKSDEAYADELNLLLKNAVKSHLVSDVPLGVFLSGGVDSSAVCALMQQNVPGKVKTFNIGFEEKSFDESFYARQVANYLGTDHHHHVLSANEVLDVIPRMMDYLDEPFGDASFIPTLLLSRFTKNYVTVSLSGDGGDELFAGYPTYQAFRLAKAYKLLPMVSRRFIERMVTKLPVSERNLSIDYLLKKFISGVSEQSQIRQHYRWLGSFGHEDKETLLTAETKSLLTAADEYKVAQDCYDGCQAKDELEKILFCDQRFYLQDNMLVKIDRATMAASLEGRVPFLDDSLVSFGSRLPSHLKLHHLTTKYLLKKTAAKLLPKQIVYRKKKGFGIPLSKWFKNQLKPLLLNVFDETRIKKQGIFNSECLQKYLRDHFNEKKDNRKELYTLLNFQLWFDQYLKP